MARRLRWRNPEVQVRRPAPVVSPKIAATVVARPELLRAITAAAARAGRDETGGPLLGTVQRSWEQPAGRLVVAALATVPPAPGLEAGPASVALGRGDGQRAAAALAWWRAVTALDLVHLGDWHRHPSGMPRPSPGDAATARLMAEETAAPIWLTAVAVSDHRREEAMNATGNLAWASAQTEHQIEVRCYRADDAGGLEPVPLRVEADAIPALPPLPWHLADPMRFATECRLLHAAGYRVALAEDSDGFRPSVMLRACRNGDRRVLIRTGARYPYDSPIVLDGRGRPVTKGHDWSPDRFLVDLVGEAA